MLYIDCSLGVLQKYLNYRTYAQVLIPSDGVYNKRVSKAPVRPWA